MLKKSIVTSFKELITNRHLTVLAIVLLVLTAGFITYLAFAVQPSELQLVTHYTAFGVTNLYRDQWFYLLTFIGFAIVSAFLHIALAIKVYLLKGHPLALLMLWTGIGMILFAWITAISILNVWSPVQ